MRNRAFRRHQTNAHMWRRLKSDRNQHYNDLTCPCWTDPRIMSRFKEQPKLCSCWMCRNRRYDDGHTIQELKFLAVEVNDEEN